MEMWLPPPGHCVAERRVGGPLTEYSEWRPLQLGKAVAFIRTDALVVAVNKRLITVVYLEKRLISWSRGIYLNSRGGYQCNLSIFFSTLLSRCD